MNLQKLIDLSFQRARRENTEHILPEHLAYELLIIPEIKSQVFAFGVKDIDAVLSDLENYTKKSSVITPVTPEYSYFFEIVIKQALAHATVNGKDVTVLDVFLSLIRENELYATKILKNYGLNIPALVNFHYATENSVVREKHSSTKSKKGKDKVNLGKERLSPIEPAFKALEMFTENLVELANQGKLTPCIGRKKEIDKIVHTLLRKTKNSVILSGSPGVGKTATVEGLAQRIAAQKDVPVELKDLKIFSLDVNSLIAGAKHHGSFEERIKNITDEMQRVGNAVLFIDEIQTIVGVGGSGNMDLATILRTLVSRGKLKVIGCVTDEDYRRYMDKDAALTRRFYKIEVEQPTHDEAVIILKGLRESLEKHYGFKIADSAIQAAVELSSKYLHEKFLPDKAIDLLDSTLAKAKLEGNTATVTEIEVRKEITGFIKISDIDLSEDDKTRLANLEKRLSMKIFGQKEAVDKVVNAIYVSKCGLRAVDKTIANFLFQGPTASGKTELSKELAKNLGIELVRFDLSAYQEKFTLSALIGSPPGYLGYGDGKAGDGLLINALEKNPNCVLLFDEVEKAHPDVINILLQVMDYGMLSSASGKSVSCRNAVLIMTSNVGAESEEKHRIGFGDIDNSDKFEEAYKNMFRPEFRSRIDAVVKFRKLGSEQLKQVVLKIFDEMCVLVAKQKITLELSDNALNYLTQKAESSHSGARIVNSLIDTEIKPKLAELLIHAVKPKSKYQIDYKDSGIIVV